MSNPSGLCMCGCGEITRVSEGGRGYKSGEHLRFIRGHNGPTGRPDYREEDRGYSTPCWIWLKSRTPKGYGSCNRKSTRLLAHRCYYELHVGPIPVGHEVHHLCEEPSCVNPDHLQAITPREHRRLDGRLEHLARGRELLHQGQR